MSSNISLPQEVYDQAVELQISIANKNAESDQLRHEAAAAVHQLLDLVAPYQTRNWMGNPFGGPGLGMPGGGMPGGGMPGGGMPGGGMPGGGMPGGGMPGGGMPGGGMPGGMGTLGGPGGSGLPWNPSPGYNPGGGGQQWGGQGVDPPVQAPTSPPPSTIPPKPFSATGAPGTFAVDPGAISRCMFRFTYVWLTNREQFWFFPIFVGPTSVAGFRWFPQFFNWRYFGIDLRRIESFTC